MTMMMVKYVQMIAVILLVILLASCGMENFPDLKNVPQIPDEKGNDDNRPAIELEASEN